MKSVPVYTSTSVTAIYVGVQMQFKILNIYSFFCNFQIKYLRAHNLDDFALKTGGGIHHYKRCRFQWYRLFYINLFHNSMARHILCVNSISEPWIRNKAHKIIARLFAIYFNRFHQMNELPIFPCVPNFRRGTVPNAHTWTKCGC